MDVGDVVCVHFFRNRAEINALGLREVESSLDAGVEEDAVNVRVGLHDVLDELRNLVQLRDVELYCLGLLFAMLRHELVQLLLSAASNNDRGAILDQLACESPADTRSGTKNEYFVIVERHCDLGLRCEESRNERLGRRQLIVLSSCLCVTSCQRVPDRTEIKDVHVRIIRTADEESSRVELLTSRSVSTTSLTLTLLITDIAPIVVNEIGKAFVTIDFLRSSREAFRRLRFSQRLPLELPSLGSAI